MLESRSLEEKNNNLVRRRPHDQNYLYPDSSEVTTASNLRQSTHEDPSTEGSERQGRRQEDEGE